MKPLSRIFWDRGVNRPALSPRSALALLLAALAISAEVSSAQPYEISSSVIGGGSSSTGGPYVLNATIGQPDTAFLEGGHYQLLGGFLDAPLIIPISGGPTLTLLRSGNSISISWPSSATGFVLESTDNLSTGPMVWNPVGQAPVPAGDQQVVTVQLSTQNTFYRLRGK